MWQACSKGPVCGLWHLTAVANLQGRARHGQLPVRARQRLSLVGAWEHGGAGSWSTGRWRLRTWRA
jgi:hypothetical protein